MITTTIDAGALIDSSPWTGYQKFLTGLTALAIVIDGFDIQVLAFAIPSLMKEWHVARGAFAPVLALGLAGMAAGGPVFGYWGDRFGRRSALIGSVLVFALATVATAGLHSVEWLSLLRFVTGLGAGGAMPNASALSAEFAPAKRRPVAVKLTIVCIPLGGMLGGLLAAQVLPDFGWRALYAIGGLLPLLVAALLWWLLPESPRFLANRESGWPALARFLNRAGHHVPPASRFAEGATLTAAKFSLSELWARSFARDTAGLWLAFFSCLSAVYLVFGWLPTLLTSQGLAVGAASSALATYNLGGVVGVLLWAMLTSLFGSRKPLLFGAAAAAVSALAVLQVPSLLWIALGLHGLLANAVQTSMYALGAHIYPTRIRASGVACAGTVGRLGGILSSLFGAFIIGRGAAAYWGAIAVALLLAFAGLALVRNHIPAPEVKG